MKSRTPLPRGQAPRCPDRSAPTRRGHPADRVARAVSPLGMGLRMLMRLLRGAVLSRFLKVIRDHWISTVFRV